MNRVNIRFSVYNISYMLCVCLRIF